MILIKKKLIKSKIYFDLNRDKKRFIKRDNTFNIILILLILYFTSIRKRYRYLKIYIKRRLSFFVNIILILF